MSLNWENKTDNLDTIYAEDFNNLVESIEKEFSSAKNYTDSEVGKVIGTVSESALDDLKESGLYKVVSGNYHAGYIFVQNGNFISQYHLKGVYSIQSITEAIAQGVPIWFRYSVNNGEWTAWKTFASVATEKASTAEENAKSYADTKGEEALASAKSYTDEKNKAELTARVNFGDSGSLPGATGGISRIKFYANGYPTVEEGVPLSISVFKGSTYLAGFSAPVDFGGDDYLEFDPINAVAIDWFKDGQWYQNLSDGLAEPTAFLNKMAEADLVVISDSNAEYTYADVTYTATVSAKLDSEIERAKAAESEALTSAKSYADTKAAAAEENAKTYGKQTFAGALKNEKTGGIVRLDDVSALDGRLDTVVSSKNIIPFPYADGMSKTANGVTFTVSDDGSITVNGTASSNTQFYLAKHDLTRPVENGETYTLKGRSAGVGDIYHFVQDLRYADGTRTQTYVSAESDTVFTCTGTGKQEYLSSCYIMIKSGTVLDSVVVKPQLERGNVSTAYAKYVSDLSGVSLKKYGKNLIPYPYNYGNQTTVNGVTFTASNDGSVTANGTATETALYLCSELTSVFMQSGTYALSSGVGDDNSGQKYGVVVGYLYNGGTRQSVGTLGGVKTVTLTENAMCDFVIVVRKGQTVNNLVFRPQFEAGESKTAFEAYKAPETYTVSTDGSVANLSANEGTTTLVTDSDSAVLKTKYSRDLSAAFTEIQNAIIALGGSF